MRNEKIKDGLGPYTIKALLFSIVIVVTVSAIIFALSMQFNNRTCIREPIDALYCYFSNVSMSIFVAWIFVAIPLLLISVFFVPLLYSHLVHHLNVNGLNCMIGAGLFSILVFLVIGVCLGFAGLPIKLLIFYLSSVFGIGAITGFIFHRLDQGKWW